MNFSPIIDTAISLVFIYMLLSIIVTSISEIIAQFLNTRGKMLKKALHDVLNDSRLNKEYTDLLYSHPMVDLMKETQTRLPSYLSAPVFAKTIIDVIGREYDNKQYEFIKNEETGEYESRLTGKLITDQHLRFSKAVGDMKHSDLKILFNQFITQSTDASTLLKNIESWYNSYMDRVSGWYKRDLQWKLFFISLGVAVVLNVNTVEISKYLWLNESARTYVSSAAVDYYKQHPDSIPLTEDAKKDFQDNLKIVGELNLPIGWEIKEDKNFFASVFSFWKEHEISFWNSLFGWLLTAFALRFGAPFWFDLLKKLVNIRGGGANPSEKKVKEE